MSLSKIVVFDMSGLGSTPRILTVDTAVASALVRAGVAAAHDSAQAGALSMGGALSNVSPTQIVLVHGPQQDRVIRITVPLAAAQAAADIGAAAGVVAPLASSGAPVLPTQISISGAPNSATIGSAFAFTPNTANGLGPKTFSYAGTSLATYGASFNTATGTISTGTVTGSVGAISGAISVTDATGTASLPVNIPVVAGTPSISLSGPIALPEGNSGSTQFNFVATLDRKGQTGSYPGTWTTAGDGANPADVADFGGSWPAGGLTFAPGETSKSIPVLAMGDTAVENDEGFAVTLTVPGIGSVTSKGTILNDDNVVINAPAASTIKAMPANGKNTITWTDGANGGSALTSRKIYAANGPAVKIVPANLVATLTTETSYDHTVPNGQLRYYKMVVANTAGNSPASNEDSSQPYVAPTAAISANRAKLQLGMTGVDNSVVSRLYTNLITTPFGLFLGYGNVPTLIDSTIWDAETGSLKKYPATGVPQNYLQHPWPYGSGASKIMRIWCSRPEAVFHLNVGAFSGAQPLAAKDGGIALDFTFNWPSGSDVTAWNTNWVSFAIDSLPDATVDGLGYSEFYAAEIDAIGGNWIVDPRVNTISQAFIERASAFGVVRPMDTRVINQNFSMTTPLTAANRPRYKAIPGSTYADGTVHDASAVFSVGGGTITVNALKASQGFGLVSFSPGNVGKIYNFAEPLFNPVTTPGAPYYPYGARANEMGVQFAAPSGASATFTWNGTTKTVNIKPKAGMTWSQLAAAWETQRASFDNTVNNVVTHLLADMVVSSGLTNTVCTASGRIAFTGGQTVERQGQMSVEQIVEIAWRANLKAVWYQIPANADESYIRAEVAYLRDHLPPTCSILFEFANEVWNADFGVNAEVKAYGFANNPYGWKQDGTGAAADPYGTNALLWGWSKLATDKVTIAKDEWKKTGRTDCRGIFAGQAGPGSATFWDQILTFSHGAAWNAAFDDMAIAPYWPTALMQTNRYAAISTWAAGTAYKARGSQLYDSAVLDELLVQYGGVVYVIKDAHTSAAGSEPGTAGGAAHYTVLTPEVYEPYGKTAIDGQSTIISGLKTWATNHGKRMLAYEGGPGDQYNDPLMLPYINALSHSDVMRRLTKYALYSHFVNMGSDSLYAQFGDTAPWVGLNPWRFQDYDGAPGAISPNRRALEDFATNGPANPYAAGAVSSIGTINVAINNTNGVAKTNYAVKVPVTWQAGMLANFNDIRFFDGSTELSYWMDYGSRVDGTSCIFWVKIPSLTVATKNITLRYGGATADTLSTSEGAFTFAMYDGFERGIDPSRWISSTSQYGWTFSDVWRANTLMTGKPFGQGLYADANGIYCSANQGANTNGIIYKFNYDGTAGTPASFAGPPHGNCACTHFTTGNMLWCSAGDTVQNVVWEIKTDGTKVRVWNMAGKLAYANGPNMTSMGNGKYLAMSGNSTGDASAVQQITLNDDLTITIEKTWQFTYDVPIKRMQGVYYENSTFYCMVDDGAGGDGDNGQFIGYSLNSDGTMSVVSQWQHLPATERESLVPDPRTPDGNHYLYSTNDGSIYQLEINRKRKYAMAVTGSVTNAKATLTSVATFPVGYAVEAYTAMSGNYPSIGFSSTDNAEQALTGHLISADSFMKGRLKTASANAGAYIDTDLAAATGYTAFHTVGVKRRAAVVEFSRDGAVLASPSASMPTASLPVMLGGQTTTSAQGFRLSVDHVLVRETQEVEPTVTVGNVAPVAWTPANMGLASGTHMWVQADDVVAKAAADGSSWTNHDDATMVYSATGTTKPTLTASALNGKPVYTFDGTDDFLAGNTAAKSLASNRDCIVMAALVIPNAAGTGNQNIFWNCTNGGSTASKLAMSYNGSTHTLNCGARRLDAESGATNAVGTIVAPAGTPFIVVAIVNWAAGTVTLRVNGVQDVIANFPTTGKSEATASSGCGIGATVSSSRMYGAIAELLAVATTPSLDTVQKIEGYLASSARWGVQSVLPSDHPYKVAAPTA